ncbi:TMEM175 family protein [Methanoregula sp.]|uniref:TMEM175 family protein n=1 Tax=Methanoregula sp. TaxID=2052170 RepID=UPI00356594EE
MDPINKVNLERLTNGIYAFTMTLMVRNIQAPVAGAITDDLSFAQYLISTFLSVADFVGAFLILGMFWLFYFQMFHRMKTFDYRFLYLHLFSLMIVVFVPFTNSFANQSVTVPASNILFQVNYLILAILLTWQWHHARAHPELLEPELNEAEASFLAKKFLVPLGVAIFGIILVCAGVEYIDLLYLLPFAVLGVFFRKGPGEASA